jgi:hypothetical protein
MKVFVSSVVGGLEPFRDAVESAAKVLRHEVKRSEDFGTSPETPQQACLAGVRWADVVVLLLGGRYGETQASGLSATHEEYREAKVRCPVVAFVQAGVEPEPAQEAFIQEVRDWAGGVLTGEFGSTDDLRDVVTRALHDVELSSQSGPLDEAEMAERAQSLIPDRYGVTSATLCVVTVAGPRQQVLRPVELEDENLERDLHREALLGDDATFERSEGVRSGIDADALVLQQATASLRLDSLGSVRIMQPATNQGAMGLPALIEEVVGDHLRRALRLSAWVLERIDPVRRLTHVAPTVALLSGAYLGWRTLEEHAASPNSIQMSSRATDRVVVGLTPVSRPRAALTFEASQLTEDFLVLLRRAYRA